MKRTNFADHLATFAKSVLRLLRLDKYSNEIRWQIIILFLLSILISVCAASISIVILALTNFSGLGFFLTHGYFSEGNYAPAARMVLILATALSLFLGSLLFACFRFVNGFIAFFNSLLAAVAIILHFFLQKGGLLGGSPVPLLLLLPLLPMSFKQVPATIFWTIIAIVLVCASGVYDTFFHEPWQVFCVTWIDDSNSKHLAVAINYIVLVLLAVAHGAIVSIEYYTAWRFDRKVSQLSELILTKKIDSPRITALVAQDTFFMSTSDKLIHTLVRILQNLFRFLPDSLKRSDDVQLLDLSRESSKSSNSEKVGEHAGERSRSSGSANSGGGQDGDSIADRQEFNFGLREVSEIVLLQVSLLSFPTETFSEAKEIETIYQTFLEQVCACAKHTRGVISEISIVNASILVSWNAERRSCSPVPSAMDCALEIDSIFKKSQPDWSILCTVLKANSVFCGNLNNSCQARFVAAFDLNDHHEKSVWKFFSKLHAGKHCPISNVDREHIGGACVLISLNCMAEASYSYFVKRGGSNFGILTKKRLVSLGSGEEWSHEIESSLCENPRDEALAKCWQLFDDGKFDECSRSLSEFEGKTCVDWSSTALRLAFERREGNATQ